MGVPGRTSPSGRWRTSAALRPEAALPLVSMSFRHRLLGRREAVVAPKDERPDLARDGSGGSFGVVTASRQERSGHLRESLDLTGGIDQVVGEDSVVVEVLGYALEASSWTPAMG